MGKMKEIFTEMYEMQTLEMETEMNHLDDVYWSLKAEIDELLSNVGKKVAKSSKKSLSYTTARNRSFKSPKPFKSGLKINTIKGVIEHPILHIPAYTFVEDDSYVECRRCKIAMTVEVWQDKESTTVLVKGDTNKKWLTEPDAVLVRTIHGIDWDDCMRQHFELMGWEPYKPF